MVTVGIIVEYNPFHNGHKYHIDEAKRITGADYVVAVMSGNYVQRGAPAIVDKKARTEMALLNGVDLVLELPVLYSCASANFFAYASVDLLNKIGIIDYLCFGSECEDLSILNTIADILVKEPPYFKIVLKEKLKCGCSYPVARTNALISTIENDTMFIGDYKLEDIKNIISKPNNMLGIEYLVSLKIMNSYIKPINIKRLDKGYHSLDIQNGMASATNIRNLLLNSSKFSISSLNSIIPELSTKILKEYLTKYKAIDINDFSIIFISNFFNENNKEYFDTSKDLFNRILNNLDSFINLSEYANTIKTKNYTLTSINRSFFNIILNITQETFYRFWNGNVNYYIRILGFNKINNNILKNIKINSQIPIITKTADYKNVLLNADAINLFEIGLNADNVYRTVLMNKSNCYIKNEFNSNIIII